MLDNHVLKDLKEKMIEVIKIMYGEGLFEMSTGHVSTRVPDSEVIMILGHMHHYGKTLNEATVDDLVLINMEGNLVEGNLDPPGERFIHTGIYRHRQDVEAVVHNHSRLAVAFSVAGKEILPLGFRGSIFYPKVPICSYTGMIDSKENGEIVAKALGTGCSVLLQGHGAVTVGDTLEEMCCAAIALEATAETQLFASLLGTAKPLTADQLAGRFVRGITAEGYFNSAWSFYRKKHRECLKSYLRCSSFLEKGRQ